MRTAHIHHALGIIEVTSTDHERIEASIGITALMRDTKYEVVTKRGGPHDACDIIDTEWRRWSELDEDNRREVIEQEVETWSKLIGFPAYKHEHHA